jgi:sulfopropanediol 3-dehydrogenase
MQYLKRAEADAAGEDRQVAATVEAMLDRCRREGVPALRAYAKQFDGWTGDFVLSAEKKARLIATVPARAREDIAFAHRQIRNFAEAQRASLTEFEIETEPGVRLGQRIVPVDCAGCYVPGGRYAHIASALMSVTTAKVAGVGHVVAATPPRGDAIDASVAYALDLAGADVILELGGVPAIAAMAFGTLGTRPADILVGPGNAYVAEAKRLLFGEVGIDVFAGPTETAVIADASADPLTIAIDLASQAEHGPNSPCWLITTSPMVAEVVARLMPALAEGMPSGDVVAAAWRNHGEIVLCEDREEAAAEADAYAPEHLQVMAEDLDWWKARLRNYGSLFLGEGSTVTHGDKCSGTNHILPTKRAARYTGGLNVMKFLKILTWQSLSPEASLAFGAVGSRISRMEGMDAHARACDWRLRRYYPGRNWDFEVAHQPPVPGPGSD